MNESFHEVINRLGDRVISNNGTQAEALCPAHDDTNPSLGVGIGKKGDRCVINCRKGCSRDEILSAIGMTVSQLYDDHHRGSSSLVTVATRTAAVKSQPKTKPKTIHSTVRRAGEAMLWAVQQKHFDAILAATFLYHSADGRPFGAVFRFNFGDGEKSFGQATATPSGGWVNVAGDQLWPLFNLHELPAAGTVTIHEGEKAALAAEVADHGTHRAAGCLQQVGLDAGRGKPAAGVDAWSERAGWASQLWR
jgi:hypothetical protein